MKRAFLCIATTFSIALLFASEGCGNGVKFNKERENGIISYFADKLNEKSTSFNDNLVIKSNKITDTRKKVWQAWHKAVNAHNEERLIELSNLSDRKTGSWQLPATLEESATMPYYWGTNCNFDKERKYPMFLYMHGSGNKDQEWETGLQLALHKFYKPAIYFIPQIPNAYGEYYRWAIQSKQWAWEKLLRQAFLCDNIDANRIYFFGISEGGYGSQRLASFYADYLAGAGPMAGGEPLKNAPMENLANIAFSLRTGSEDMAFMRNYLTANAGSTADSLAYFKRGYYKHYIELIAGRGHSIDYSPTTPWLAQHTRNPHPNYFYWENYEMYGRKREGFYNLRVNKPSTCDEGSRTCYEMNIEENTITLNVRNVKYTCTYALQGIEMFFSKSYSEAKDGDVTIYLNEKLFDLNKPIKIVLNGREIFNGKVEPSLKAMVESCALYYDPERVFPASINVNIEKEEASL